MERVGNPERGKQEVCVSRRAPHERCRFGLIEFRLPSAKLAPRT
jgi:hypothetical protein